MAEKLKQTLINISDKLAAIFGEPIVAAEKFIAENWKKLKKFDQVTLTVRSQLISSIQFHSLNKSPMMSRK